MVSLDGYYSVAKAASLFGVSPSTIWRWIATGTLPAYRVGPRRIRIKSTDLEAVVRPARKRAVELERTSEGIWVGYDPASALEAFRETAGALKGVDARARIAWLYRARKRGSRPARRP